MKMRKTLSFVLVLALVLGSFSMVFGAGVAQGSDLSDIGGNANYDAIVANSDLGIITGYEDGSYKPANNVNRAEFAAMITRMLGVPDSALAGYSSTSFTDMTGYGWASSYVGFCAAKGIVNGYGDGTFGPGNTITVNEAVTMVLRAVGYVSNSNALVGTWPSNYVTLGKRLGVYDDVASTTTIDRANAAQVIYNALTCKVVAVDADGKTTDAYVEDDEAKTVLEVYLDCNLRDAAVYTDTDAESSVINTLEYVGAYVKAIENSDEEVIAIADVKSTFVKGDYNDDDNIFEVGDIEYNLDDTLADNPLFEDKDGDDDDAYTFTNGEEINQDAAALTDGETYTLAVKLSGKTIKEVYSVTTWESEPAFQFEADMLEDDALNGYEFALDDDDNIDTKAYSLLGVASLDKIAEDNVVRVYLKGNTPNEDIVKVTVGTETVEGKITLADDDDQEVTIGGKVYAVAEEAEGFDADLDENLGDTGTAYLDYDGDIAFWDVKDAESDNFAMVTDALDKVTRDISIILFDKAGAEKEYVVKNSANVTDGDGDALADDGDTVGTVEDLVVPGPAPTEFDGSGNDLVTFALDKNGKVTDLTARTLDPISDGELSTSRTIFENKRVADDVVVFATDLADPGDYSIVDIKDVKTGELEGNTYIYLDDQSKIKAMVIDDAYTGAESVYALLNSVKTTYNDSDDKVQVIKGVADGKEYTGYTDDESVVTADDFVYGEVGAIAIAKLSVNSDGVVTKAVDNATELTAIKNGYVMSKSGRDLGLVDDLDDATIDYCAIDPKAVIYILEDGEYETGTWSSLQATVEASERTGSFVYLYQVDDDSEVYDFVVIDKGESDLDFAAAAGQAAATAEAADVALTLTATGAANNVVMPTVGGAFTIAVSTTSDPTVYNASGEILTNGSSNVVYTVTHTASGKTAVTGTVVVTVTVL